MAMVVPGRCGQHVHSVDMCRGQNTGAGQEADSEDEEHSAHCWEAWSCMQSDIVTPFSFKRI